ncbi:hypothetical protein KAM329D_39480 [Aeromonas caviae]|uniref:NYN domain-containing protein n=1 Tax=Aeromonas TaxID=642 RepID=UPI0018A5FB04|nr:MULTISPECIES: NYN domain-containing protein [Aeromonas]HDO1355039.1 NYN domain-containing protein [Aeromonas veronii]MCF3099316.1 NYN domain-containing protein [Aeromonas australiensis]MEA9429416.1 NYN domain-containing protein [Aeromonas caviae]BCM75667.1 hypothetical protein KAM329_022160 [Aeromonas caviae]GJC24967.1 hypothetical protein KAM329D_39480 [Aeromonas caviae]
MKDKDTIALFIDADNAPARKIETVLSELALYGVVNIRKAYGNWKNANLKPWEDVLHEYAIQPVQQFDLAKGKNATDMALVIDVMDVLYTKDIDVICLVSSDCDFTPLVTRCLADGKLVVGFGERKASMPFVNSCSKFLYLDPPLQTVRDADPVAIHAKNLKGDTRLISLLRQAIDAVETGDGWASLGGVGSHISNHASFDPRNYGFRKLSDLFAAIDLFELKKNEKSGLMVRNLRTAPQIKRVAKL